METNELIIKLSKNLVKELGSILGRLERIEDKLNKLNSLNNVKSDIVDLDDVFGELKNAQSCDAVFLDEPPPPKVEDIPLKEIPVDPHGGKVGFSESL